jgi:tetratricopeptide (TPR) repeat protein
MDQVEDQSGVTSGTVPVRLGPCRVVDELGAGGMGRVFLAELEEGTSYGAAGDRIAVKVLHPHLLDRQEEVQRFQRESELGAHLVHENVVRTLDSGEEVTDIGTVHYLVMEYVEGRTLRDLLDAMTALPEPLLRDIAVSISDGLAAIHAEGVTHRDIKPANILITPDYQVKIMDLGVAHTMADVTRLTQTGQIVGTLQYLAPEQLADNHAGAYSDLYSLGVVLYEAATGTQPFRTDSVASSIWRLLEHIPPAPTELNPQLTPFFERVILRLIEKQPDNRFSSAAELAEVLSEAEGSTWWRDHETTYAPEAATTFRIQVSRESPFVGRESELQMLLTAMKEVQFGNDRLVYIEGEPGVGKTRLIDSFTEHLGGTDDRVQVLYGAYSPGGYGAGTGAVGQAVVDFFGSSLLTSRLEYHLHAAAGLAPAFAAYLEGRAPPEGSAPLSAEAVQGLYRKLARSLARAGRTVWIVDDAHFASADSRGTIASIARQLGSLGIMMIVTSRPGASMELASDLLQLPCALRLKLDRLDADAVVAILERKVTRRRVARRLGAQLAARTDGNPFFVFEIIREMEDQGVLQKLAESPTETTKGYGLFSIPASVRELLQSRLAELSDDERAILDVASVQGFTFDADLISRILEMKRLKVLQVLANLERRRALVRTVGRNFTFDHPQLQELIYESLPHVLREEYHALLAKHYVDREGLEGTSPEAMSADAVAFLAEHFFRGHRPETGRPFALVALDHLRSRHQNDSIVQLADVMVPTLEDDPGLTADIQVFRSDALGHLGDTDGALQAGQAAAAAAGAAGDQSRKARALLRVGRQQMVGVDFGAADDSFRSALESAEAGGDERAAIDALQELGRLVHWMGRFADAEDLFVRQLERAQADGVVEQECEARALLANLYLGLARLDEALAQAREHLRAADDAGLRESQTMALFNLGQIAIWHGDYATAEPRFDEQLELARDVAFLPAETLAHLALSQVCFDTGRIGEAGRHAEHGIDLAEVARFSMVIGYFKIRSGDVKWAERDMSGAVEAYREAVALFRQVGANQGIAEALTALGRIVLESGENDEAGELFREAAGLVEEHGLSSPGPLPAAYLTLLESTAPPTWESGRCTVLAETHVVLARAGAGADHLATAREMLGSMSEHLGDEARERFWLDNPVARMVARDV